MHVIAVLELLVAASLWGFGFVAAIWAMTEVNASELSFVRFALAALLLAPMALRRSARQQIKTLTILSFWPGVLLAGTLLVQTWGLQYTTATKSGFITTLYVVFVPLLESALTRTRLPRQLIACVALSFLGALLIVNINLSEMNKGDGLTLLCALIAAVQIYVVGWVSPKVDSPFLFNSLQATWAALFCLPFAWGEGLVTKISGFAGWSTKAQIGLLALAFGSTVIAFTLQVRAQKTLSPTVSSLLFLLESPMALLFAMLFLQERLGGLEALGAGLIFFSAVAASLVESRRER
jgi:drug/metabolite transporter (DMT)-like permease